MHSQYKRMVERAAKAIGLPIIWKPDPIQPGIPNSGCWMATYIDPMSADRSIRLTLEFDPANNIQQAMMLLAAKRYDLKVNPCSVEVIGMRFGIGGGEFTVKVDSSGYYTEMHAICMAITAAVADQEPLRSADLRRALEYPYEQL